MVTTILCTGAAVALCLLIIAFMVWEARTETKRQERAEKVRRLRLAQKERDALDHLLFDLRVSFEADVDNAITALRDAGAEVESLRRQILAMGGSLRVVEGGGMEQVA